MEHYITCPNCDNLFVVNNNELNCMIFRHGVYKNNMKPINPHLSKEKCDLLIKRNLIYGCGKPFKLFNINNDNTFVSIKCNYI